MSSSDLFSHVEENSQQLANTAGPLLENPKGITERSIMALAVGPVLCKGTSTIYTCAVPNYDSRKFRRCKTL